MKNDYINIISIDPGTNMGISIITLEIPSLRIVSVNTCSIDLSLLTKPNELENNLLLRTQAIMRIVTGIMEDYKPRVLAMEAAFVNTRFPKSVMYLSQYIASISLAVTTADPFIKIFNYPPKKVKATVSVGGANKDDMLTAVSKIDELNKHIVIETLTEHEIDSLAIGYAYIKELRENPVLMLMI